MLGNNVLAHVPDINDFVGGFKILLGPTGIVTIEFPHLLKMMDELYYDQIYHEHYSYLSFHTVEKIFAAHGLTIFDVDEIKPQGGSLAHLCLPYRRCDAPGRPAGRGDARARVSPTG